MRQLHTFNQYHLGDNLVHLHFLRALAKQHPELFFTHTCDAKHIAQLHPVVADLPNLSLTSDWSQLPPGALNAWRGDNNHWYCHPLKLDFARYHVEAWFPVLAERMGLLCPFRTPADLQFDYPALKDNGAWKIHNPDILIINSPPMSGQAAGYDPQAFINLALQLQAAGHEVATTHETGVAEIWCTLRAKLDVTHIGCLSQRCCKAVIGVSTGPKWTTMNVWNRDTVKLRLLLLDTERVWISPNTVHANNVSLFREIIKDHGLL